MSIKTFWIILIKILGLLLIFGALTIVPQWFYSIYSAYQTHDFDSFIMLISILLIVLFVYFIVFKFCIYKSSWIIEKLKLDKGFEDEKIELNSKGNRIISIAIIVIGGLMFVESIPILFKQIFVFFQQESLLKDYPGSGWMIFNFVKVIIGYLLMTNSFRIANLIEKEK
ncbi:hypothetical protein Q1W71_04760 [Flavobacterium pectinovorum]|uniref:hypothetical protein n=1 Tax=Flavobacterium pectinovorum TaxID=29533 RepID=UPI00265F8926|nr:hypothetical protein [Flavobacterium pectinovorum]WKL49098.1 hypothetical protein Q1W71_04760 [Flavobacterium pectinovorum]